MDPFPKMKSEDYRLLGGINSKVSFYDNDPMQFRDISNLNFVITGALSKRCGTTLFGGGTFQLNANFPAVTSGFEFSKLDGQSFMVVANGGFLLQSYATFVISSIEFNSFNPVTVRPGSLFSFVAFSDRLFACDGNQFLRMSPFFGASSPTNPLNAFLYSLPADSNFDQSLGPTFWFANAGTTGQLGSSTNGFGSSTNGLSGTYVFGYAFVNDRGFVGPPSKGVTLTATSMNSTTAFSITIGYCNQLRNFYGVTAIMMYRSEIDGVVMAATTLAPISFAGNTTVLYDPGMTLLATAPVATLDYYMPANGATFVGSQNGVTLIYPSFCPRFLEVYNNQLFMAGFSALPSTFFWSEIGEPEGVQPDFSAEVRTNDGDVISGMRSYLGALFISKRKSCHLLTGTSPVNFSLQEISDQYGCVSHRAMVPWNNVLWFLDSKGVMQYDGANLSCVSTAVEPIFAKMNLQAAFDNACGIHVKKFNEIWFAIPANGSTINNQIVVFDYVANAWTHYDGVDAQCLFNAFGGFPYLTPFAGNYTGGLVYFDPTLTSDVGSAGNPQGVTCSFSSVFFAARGQTTENMYRRFYLNLDPILGFTQGIGLQFQSNFATATVYAATMFQNPYQSRIDFGISARSLQVSMTHYSASLALVIRGFSVESRFQRPV